ncbi:MAG: RsmE family RNA methyltransferase [Patescibacteria group bacterium]
MKKIHRFLLPVDLSHQIRDVLKIKTDEVVDLMDGQGMEFQAKIVSTAGPVEVEVDSVRQNQSEPMVKVILYCAILKRENFELVAQKATEVGVHDIVPIITERTIKTGLKLARLQKIAAEAAEQSGRGVVPTVHKAMTFKQALVDCARNDVNYFFDPSGQIHNKRPDPIQGSIGLFIGPEGGWTDNEIALAKQADLVQASLGRLTLRGETAAIVASYLATSSKL